MALLAGAPAQAGWFGDELRSDDVRRVLEQPRLMLGGAALNTDEVNAFYRRRNFRPAWGTQDRKNHAGLAAFLDSITVFATYHGLQPEAYPVVRPDQLDAVQLELLTTARLLRLAHDLHGDTVNLAQLYPGWDFQRSQVDLVAGLAAAADANRVTDFIGGLIPADPAYGDLVRALQAYRALAGPWPMIAPGPSMELGDEDVRVRQIRARLAAEGYLSPPTVEASGAYFDDELEQAVLAYQRRNGLEADGIVGTTTLAAMNVAWSERIAQITANMARWRQMPEPMPGRYAQVNIADATLTVIEDGQIVYRDLVIVGRVDRKTPFIQSKIRSVIFNPAWHVPARIAREDILRKLRKDPHYLEKMGFVINGSADDPHGINIDWKKIKDREFHFRLRQSPGDMNSLGRLKFDFDNDFSVYMHGTPHQELFDLAARFFSSGCIRLQDPVRFAQLVLAYNAGGWDSGRVQEEIYRVATRWLRIDVPLPLRVVYWTVFTDGEGKLNFRHDIYDYDRLLSVPLNFSRAQRPIFGGN